MDSAITELGVPWWWAWQEINRDREWMVSWKKAEDDEFFNRVMFKVIRERGTNKRGDR